MRRHQGLHLENRGVRGRAGGPLPRVRPRSVAACPPGDER